MHPTKFIIISGGVISGVGKGVATASIGKILQKYGFKVTAVKIDPYINFDAGTLRPTEHGEVWVTNDGGEIDQDLGNYERFLNIDIPKKNNITTGQIYYEVIQRERKGQYLGQTVQFIPHIPREIIRRLKKASQNYEICLVEIGGTIGDYENIPFLFAAKTLEKNLGKKNVAHLLITYLPVPEHINEAKTKPTQQAIKMLSEHAIFPDFILCRAQEPLDKVRRKKIETYANIDSENVVSAPDIDSLYKIPLNFEKENFGLKLLNRLNLKPKRKPDWSKWQKLLSSLEKPEQEVNIAIVGKYLDIGNFTLEDSYISIREAVEHASAHLKTNTHIHWIDSKDFEKKPKKLVTLKKYDGLIIPGGFGSSGVEGKVMAIRFCRENNLPFLGLCYGLQLAVVEFARHVCHLKDAHTTEVNKKTPYPVIDLQPIQKKVMEKRSYGGTMRLGSYAAVLKEKSQVLKIYKKSGRLKKDRQRIKNIQERYRLGLENNKRTILERHRHRYEVNPKFVPQIEKQGLVFSGYHLRKDKTKLMEFIELKDHPFFIATQAHPEFKSSLEEPAPLFYYFLKAAKNN